jgi:hypothetical protein
MEALGCVLNPGPCLTGAADGILSIFPFGLYGVVFLGGMIVGERIGIWGILIAIVGWIALRFSSKTPDIHEHVVGKDAAPPIPKPKKRPTVRLPKLFR